jgi:hypothetical protein
MLNELMNLHTALKRLGCDLGISHRNFGPCPATKQTFGLSLDITGRVEDIAVPNFPIATVFRWHEGRGNHATFFPAFNARALFGVPDPLPPFPEESREDVLILIDALRDPRKKVLKIASMRVLDELEKRCIELWSVDIAWIERCLKDTPNAMRSMLGEIPKSYEALDELFRRSSLYTAKELRRDIRLRLREKLIKTGEKIYAEALFSVLTEAKKKRRGREHAKDFLYLLTIDDWSKYPADPNLEKYPPHHPEVQAWMALQFVRFDEANRAPQGEADAYGFDKEGAGETFIPINVRPLGGKAMLFGANDQIPCLKRYGRKGTSLFPAGTKAREMGRKAMEYILKSERKGITWKSITKYEPGQKKRKKRNTVVFAYCTEVKDANALQFFDREDDDVNHNIYRSEAGTKLALVPFDGIAKDTPDAEIVINLLAAVDPGNTKILASCKYSLSQFMEGVSRWQSGNANIPGVSLPWLIIKEKKGNDKKTSTGDAIPLYPIEAIKLLNSDWDQDGTLRTQSRRFTTDEALDFLFEGDEVISQRIETGLAFVVEKTSRVIISAALKARHYYNKTGTKIKFKDSSFLHMLPSLYGLFLFKKRIKKEDYMKEDVFYLGRYFAVVDDLYIQYHKDVRSDNVPMSLLGNDHMTLALQNPLEAFVTLSRRLAHPYISWAKRVSTDDKPGQIAKNCIRKIAELTEELSKEQLPTNIGDADKAKLLLGYLSYGAKKYQVASDNNKQENEEGEEL